MLSAMNWLLLLFAVADVHHPNANIAAEIKICQRIGQAFNAFRNILYRIQLTLANPWASSAMSSGYCAS